MQYVLDHSTIHPPSCTISGHNTSEYCMPLSAQRISYDIRFAWVIVQSEIIVHQILHPAPLPHVQISLSENITEALVIGENIELLSAQVMSPRLESMNYRR